MKAILLSLVSLALAGTALASPCGDKIAKLQSQYDASPIVAGAAPVGAAPAGAETTGAKLHHQPAPASAADAKDPAMSAASIRDARFKVEIDQARAADDFGDVANCEASVAKAQEALSP